MLSGAWTLPLDLSASVGYEEAATLLFVFPPNEQLKRTTEEDAVERRQRFYTWSGGTGM